MTDYINGLVLPMTLARSPAPSFHPFLTINMRDVPLLFTMDLVAGLMQGPHEHTD